MDTSPKILHENQQVRDLQSLRSDFDPLLAASYSLLANRSKDAEGALETGIIQLEDHLNKLLNAKDSRFADESEEAQTTKTELKAKKYFKTYAYTIIADIRTKLEKNQLYHILPSLYIKQFVENVKGNLTQSYRELLVKLSQSNSEKSNESNESSGSGDQATTQEIKKSKRRGKSKIPKKAITVLKNWLTEHFNDPYPSHSEKLNLANEAGITPKQVQNWFTNVRGRTWKKSYNEERFANQIEERLAIKKLKTERKSQPQQ